MRVLLERVHADVTVADSGPAALAALETRPQHRNRPNGHHDAAHGRLRDHPCHQGDRRRQDLPIIAVTGKVVPGEHQRCVEAGANDYVPKPVDTVELLTVMRPYLPMAAQTRA